MTKNDGQGKKPQKAQEEYIINQMRERPEDIAAPVKKFAEEILGASELTEEDIAEAGQSLIEPVMNTFARVAVDEAQKNIEGCLFTRMEQKDIVKLAYRIHVFAGIPKGWKDRYKDSRDYRIFVMVYDLVKNDPCAKCPNRFEEEKCKGCPDDDPTNLYNKIDARRKEILEEN